MTPSALLGSAACTLVAAQRFSKAASTGPLLLIRTGHTTHPAPAPQARHPQASARCIMVGNGAPAPGIGVSVLGDLTARVIQAGEMLQTA